MQLAPGFLKAVLQLLWSVKVREEWFSLGEKHEKLFGIGLHRLPNRCSFPGSAFTLRLDGIERVFRAERTRRGAAGDPNSTGA
jgi:hypothetical protein